MPTQTTLSRVESFPFDSRFDGYDDEGYPAYDRAVGATMLRSTFAKFFSDGVFPSPGSALQISKGSGLTVTIQPGIFIICGAMGGYLTDAHSLTLDTAAPQGNVCYGVMLRYDENEQYRSCYLRVVRGDAASSPQPPAPDQSTPGVMEYRLGYVTVPSGSTDLTSATVTNEKGLAVCPYAAPFEEIDVDGIVSDFRASADAKLDDFQGELNIKNTSAQQMLASFLSFLEQYRSFVQSAVDGTTAGNLQNQIDSIEEQLGDLNLAGSVDNETIAYGRKPDDAKETLHVMDYGIGTAQLADGSVTGAKISDGAVGIPQINPSAVDAADGLASFEALSNVSFDLFSIAHAFHMSQLDDLDLDGIIEWTFPDDATAQHGQWNSGGYYYADGGAA